jgi:hypothetical protein
MASKVEVFIDGYCNGSTQLTQPPFGEPWFHYWFACFGGISGATGVASISINEGGRWVWIERVVPHQEFAAVRASFLSIQPLSQNETLRSYVGRTQHLSMLIRKDSSQGIVRAKVFEPMGPGDPNVPTLRRFALELLDLLDGACTARLESQDVQQRLGSQRRPRSRRRARGRMKVPA